MVTLYAHPRDWDEIIKLSDYVRSASVSSGSVGNVKLWENISICFTSQVENLAPRDREPGWLKKLALGMRYSFSKEKWYMPPADWKEAK